MKHRSAVVEFGLRLRTAVNGHPDAPENEFGRQRWLQRKLEKEAEVEVSANTVNKWFRGISRPREDHIRSLSHVLMVDEVWLSLGRRPVEQPSPPAASAQRSSGATLVVAGLIEMQGGVVQFPDKTEEGVNLRVLVNGEYIGLQVVMPQVHEGRYSFIVAEPVAEGTRILALLEPKAEDATACVNVVDLTTAPRQKFGGFSVIEAEYRKDGRFKIGDRRSLVSPLSDLSSVGAA